jgi:hypothetical protein
VRRTIEPGCGRAGDAVRRAGVCAAATPEMAAEHAKTAAIIFTLVSLE